MCELIGKVLNISIVNDEDRSVYLMVIFDIWCGFVLCCVC